MYKYTIYCIQVYKKYTSTLKHSGQTGNAHKGPRRAEIMFLRPSIQILVHGKYQAHTPHLIDYTQNAWEKMPKDGPKSKFFLT